MSGIKAVKTATKRHNQGGSVATGEDLVAQKIQEKAEGVPEPPVLPQQAPPREANLRDFVPANLSSTAPGGLTAKQVGNMVKETKPKVGDKEEEILREHTRNLTKIQKYHNHPIFGKMLSEVGLRKPGSNVSPANAAAHHQSIMDTLEQGPTEEALYQGLLFIVDKGVILEKEFFGQNSDELAILYSYMTRPTASSTIGFETLQRELGIAAIEYGEWLRVRWEYQLMFKVWALWASARALEGSVTPQQEAELHARAAEIMRNANKVREEQAAAAAKAGATKLTKKATKPKARATKPKAKPKKTLEPEE
jgi:hypothetical protein